jgi:hypothetical protein
MKRLVLVLVVSGVVAGLSDTVLTACGSKFLVASKGARYQRVLASIQPARILFYWPEDASTREEDRWNPAASEMLESAGHTVEVSWNDKTFLHAARGGHFEVLVLPIDDARRLRPDLASHAERVLAGERRVRRRHEASDDVGQDARRPRDGTKVVDAIDPPGT